MHSDACWQWQENNDPDDQEQALFEQRLCEDVYGVAVRKINHTGKSNLRYVKCGYYDAHELHVFDATTNSSSTNGNYHSHNNASSRSVSSRSRNGFSRFLSGDRSVGDRIPMSAGSGGGGSPSEPLRNSISHNLTQASGGGVGGGGGTTTTTTMSDSYNNNNKNDDARMNLILQGNKKIKALTWGKKKDVKIPIDRFTVVRKGKTTDRTKKNTSPSSRILSLVTDDPLHMTLDIEAPTRLDRDKFARAFARFLNVPLEQESNNHDMRSVRSDMTPQSYTNTKGTS
jgi:hypothetical protein